MVSSIHCRYRAMRDLPIDALTVADRWLSPEERATWRQARAPERRTAWLAGRLLAKQVVRACLAEEEPTAHVTPAEIQIASRSAAGGLGERPRVFIAGAALAWALSIAHTARGVLVAVATEGGVSLGVDLVAPEQLRAESLAWCFTPGELRWLASAPAHDRGPARLWAMKEAVFKACQRGEGFAPQRIEVAPTAGVAVRSLQCWRVDGHVAALAVADRALA